MGAPLPFIDVFCFCFCCLTTIREIQQQQLLNTAAKYANYYVCISPPCRVSFFVPLFFFLASNFAVCLCGWRLRLFLLPFYLLSHYIRTYIYIYRFRFFCSFFLIDFHSHLCLNTICAGDDSLGMQSTEYYYYYYLCLMMDDDPIGSSIRLSNIVISFFVRQFRIMCANLYNLARWIIVIDCFPLPIIVCVGNLILLIFSMTGAERIAKL